MSESTIGQVIDGLNVDCGVDDDHLVTGAIVLLEVVEPNGDVRLSVAWSDGMSFLKRAGMLHHALVEEGR